MACDHCGSFEVAIEKWPQWVHDQCECLCHQNKTTAAREEQLNKKRRRKK